MSATIAKTVPTPQNALLARYLASLATRPLYTKAVTAGAFVIPEARGTLTGRGFSPKTKCNLHAFVPCSIVGVLGFIQEVLANHIAGVPVYASKDAPVPQRALAAAKIDLRALKIAAYGFLISAPMGHVLVGTLQKFFAGKTSRGSKIAQLLANNLVVAPIQTFGMCFYHLHKRCAVQLFEKDGINWLFCWAWSCDVVVLIVTPHHE